MSAEEFASQIGDINNDLIVTMQAAWIEWQHGDGAQAAMQWIENTLAGPGLIPQGEYATEPQSWHDANQTRPWPKCHCGRPSNRMWMGRGFCCEDHRLDADPNEPS